MAQFSIKDAVNYSLSTYSKHFVLLMSATVILTASWLLASYAPGLVAEKLGIEKITIDMDSLKMQPQDAQTDQSTMVLQKVQEVTMQLSTHMQKIPTHFTFLMLVLFIALWALYLALHLGFIKLALALKDRDNGSLSLLMAISFSQMLRYLAACILFGLYALVGLIGIAVLTIPCAMVCKNLLGDAPTVFLTVALWVGLAGLLLFWLVSYMFFPYAIADDATTGARASLSKSRVVSKGSRAKLILAIVIVGLVSGLTIMAVKALIPLMHACTPEQTMRIAQVVGMLLIVPLSMTFLSCIYRTLSPKGR